MSGDDSSSTQGLPRGLINRTGNPIGRGSRLPSVRGHRDLTLGGVQRKVFTPNLAAVKKSANKEESAKAKSKSASVSSESGNPENNEKKRSKSERGKRGRGRGREDRTIQLHSQFEQGPMGSTSKVSGGSSGIKWGGGSRSSTTGSTDGTAGKSTMKVSSETAEDKKALEHLLRDDFVSNIGSGDPKMAPVKLPLVNNIQFKSEIKTEIKEEKMEIDEEASTSQPVPQSAPMTSTRKPGATRLSAAEILSAPKTENGELLFLQLPETLPGLAQSPLTDESGPSSSGASKSADAELSARLESCKLQDCTEGLIGKLQIRESGKCQLVLGDNVMDVLPGIAINFHQELMSIRTEESSNQMVNLGPVNHKLVVSPDYTHLLSSGQTF